MVVDEHVRHAIGGREQVAVAPGFAPRGAQRDPIGAEPGDRVVEEHGRGVHPIGVLEFGEGELEDGPALLRGQILPREGVHVGRG